MRSTREVICLFLATVSILSMPMGLTILVGPGLADVSDAENLWIKFVAVLLCLSPALVLLTTLHAGRGR